VNANLSHLVVGLEASLRDVMACVDRNAKGIALIVDEDHHLIGTITDGDLRRAILSGFDLNLPVQKLMERRADTPYPVPLTAPMQTSDAELLHLMNERGLRHIPLVDDAGRVVDIALLSNLVKEYELPLAAVVMAGGFGTRLRPLTEDLPKPMLPVGDRPLLEWTLEQLRRAGIRRVNVTTHYKAEKITNYFGDGQQFGVELSYVTEECPLGTAGALGLIEARGEPLLVINGDILARVDYRAMLEHHRGRCAEMTVAVGQYETQVPYGVLDVDGDRVQRLREKPTLTFLVNAGIYLLEPSVVRCIPNGKRFDMTELIQQLLDERRPVSTFPIIGYWLDIGKHGDYVQAQEDALRGRFAS
jgi:dTDP-glucose pyrophosphorylase